MCQIWARANARTHERTTKSRELDALVAQIDRNWRGGGGRDGEEGYKNLTVFVGPWRREMIDNRNLFGVTDKRRFAKRERNFGHF